MEETGDEKGLAGHTHAHSRGQIEDGKVDSSSSIEGWQKVQLAISGI